MPCSRPKGTKEVGGEALDASSSRPPTVSRQTADTLAGTAGSAVKATAEVGEDIAVSVRAAVEGAIQDASEIGVDAAEAASATATGSPQGAGDGSGAAVEQVKRAATE